MPQRRTPRSPKRPSGNGEPSRSWRRCGATASPPPCVIDGPINGVSFRAYVEQVLVRVLAPGDIVIIDNLGSHRSHAIHAAIHRPSQAFLPVPPSSTNLNPIEQAFAKMKTLLHKADTRTINNTWRTIEALLNCFTRKNTQTTSKTRDTLQPDRDKALGSRIDRKRPHKCHKAHGFHYPLFTADLDRYALAATPPSNSPWIVSSGTEVGVGPP